MVTATVYECIDRGSLRGSNAWAKRLLLRSQITKLGSAMDEEEEYPRAADCENGGANYSSPPPKTNNTTCRKVLQMKFWLPFLFLLALFCIGNGWILYGLIIAKPVRVLSWSQINGTVFDRNRRCSSGGGKNGIGGCTVFSTVEYFVADERYDHMFTRDLGEIGATVALLYDSNDLSRCALNERSFAIVLVSAVFLVLECCCLPVAGLILLCVFLREFEALEP